LARTPENENITRSAEANAEGQANASYNQGQQDINQFNQNTAQLQAGKNVGANPYLNPQYLAAVNQMRSGALNQQNNAADQQIRATQAKTGGMNSTATTGAIAGTTGAKMRLGNELGAEQTAGDWQKNIGYQLNLAKQPLMAAGAQAPFYGTAGNMVGSTNADLTKYGLGQQAFNYSLYNKALQAAQAAAAAGVGAATGGAGVGGFGEG
jgi:hypothetical protein